MKNVAHPNMFPTASAAVAIAPADDAKSVANGTPAPEVPPPASPWANPVNRLQNAAGIKPAAEENASKEKRLSRTEQAIAHLRANGPSTGAQLLVALGIESKGGITPFIGPGLQRGEIIKDGQRYALPSQLVGHVPAQAPTSAPVEKPTRPKATETSRVPTLKDGEVIRIAASSDRTPDFTLSAADALIIAWPDGAVTVQRGGVFVELNASQARLLRVFVELRQ